MLLDDMEKDFEWFKKDEAGYLAEQNRRDLIVEKELIKFMGDEFKTIPLQTAQEIESAIKNRSARLLRLRELKAPGLLIHNEQRMLEEAMTVFNKGEYAITPSDFEYRDRFYAKQEEFFSQEHNWDWE